MEEISSAERRVFERLSTPVRIQDYLERLPANFEENGETCRSPRRVLRDKTAHCVEGALFAAAALWYHGQAPLLLDLKTTTNDLEHVVTLFRRGSYWGAISKTNHAVLRYRDPIYRSVRELAMSYFHEYFLDQGQKTLRSFSRPFDLRVKRYRGWVTTLEDCWELCEALDRSPHEAILTPAMVRGLRRADPIEREAGKIVQWRH